MTSVAKTRSAKSIMTLMGSNLLGAMVGGAFFFAASLHFDLAEMGLYAVTISIQAIIAGIVGGGLGVATIRLSSDYLIADDRPAAAGVVALAVMIAAAISPLTVGLCLGLARLSSEQPILLEKLSILVVFWAGMRSVLDTLRSGLLAQQQYTRASLLQVISAVTGLVSLMVALSGGPLTLNRLLMAHVFGLGSSAVIGFVFIYPLWNKDIHISKRQLRRLLSYARWPALAEGANLVQAYLGPLIIVMIAGSAQAGLFSLGRYPAYVFEVMVTSLYQYWLPEASREENHRQLIRFLRTQMRLAGLMGVGIVLAALLIRPLLPLLGSNFETAAPLFLPNALDFALILLLRSIIVVYHGLHKPYLELVLMFGRLLLLVGVAFILVAWFGAMGMVWAQILTSLASLGLAGWLLRRQLRESNRESVRMAHGFY